MEQSTQPTQLEENPSEGREETLMERVVERSNLLEALKRVEQNKGAPGVDGMSVGELRNYLKLNWETLKRELLQGTYKPQPVRRVEIPKPDGGGIRLLGVPTVVDRYIEQAMNQVLMPIFDPEFSERSYGFRPGRNAHQAAKQAQKYIQEGYQYVVDIDLEKFFDRVNHDMLMSRVARKVRDKRVLKLIRAYLNAGVMLNGVCVTSDEGVPQGGPLSPLLSNIMLDDLDKELEKRGHKFCRYADDCNIYVKTERAGERVMLSITDFLKKRLKLKVNREKSAVDRVHRRKFLGLSFTNERKARIRLAWKSIERFKDRIRALTKRRTSIELDLRILRLNVYIRGWMGYFKEAETPSVFKEISQWLYHRMRQCVLAQWKRPATRLRKLVGLGLERGYAAQLAYSRKGTWRLSLTPQLHKVLNRKFWRTQGLIDMSELYASLRHAS